MELHAVSAAVALGDSGAAPGAARLLMRRPIPVPERRAALLVDAAYGQQGRLADGYLERHVKWFAEKEPNGLLFVGEKGAPFRRSTFGRKWRKARAKVGLPENFRFYDLRHTGHTLSTQSGATLKDTMVRAGQSSTRAALIYQHSPLERQKEVAAGIDALVRADRQKGAERGGAKPSGADLVQDA